MSAAKTKPNAGKKSAVKEAVSVQAAAAAASASAASPILSSAPAPVRPAAAAQLHEEIRRRAYELYCERGRRHGLHEADWHRAEREVWAKYK